MNKHEKIVGALHTAFGSLVLLAAIIVFILIRLGGELSGDPQAEEITSTTALAIAGILTIIALPQLIGGLGLLLNKSWAKMIVLVVSCLCLLSIPFGTLLGIYSLWTLLRTPDTDPIMPDHA